MYSLSLLIVISGYFYMELILSDQSEENRLWIAAFDTGPPHFSLWPRLNILFLCWVVDREVL